MRNSSPLYLAVLVGCTVLGSLWAEFNRPRPSALEITDTGKVVTASNNPPLPPVNVFPFTPINQLEKFTHKSGIFSMNVPTGWIVNDNLEGGKLVVTWVDPNKNSVISVEIFPTPADSKKEDLIKIDKQFIEQSFDIFPGFYMEEATTQPDGSSRIVWGYTYTRRQDDQEKTARAVINRFLSQQGKYTTIVSVGFMEQYFDQVKPQLSQIVNSFNLNPSVELSKPSPATPKSNK
ncbi:MAG: hypothetical protein ACK4QL_02150 [Pseudanabaenaceae cyanobacterium]